MQKFLILLRVYMYHIRISSCKSILLGGLRLCHLNLSSIKMVCMNKDFTLLFLFMFLKKVINKLTKASGAFTMEAYSYAMVGICHPFFCLSYLSFVIVHW